MTVTEPGHEEGTARSDEATAPAVCLRGIDVTFTPRRAAPVTALSGIDLDIAPGDFVSLIGPSGCGKSTLLRVLADLVQPTSGHVDVLGGTPERARLERRYGFAFQQATLFDWRTVQSNVEMPLSLAGMGKQERHDRAQAMLELVRLGEFAKHRPSELSGGMQQRVAIARALSLEPQLLLMDEPFGALDEMTREHLQNELLRIWRETQTTIVFVTHSIAEAVFLSTRIVVLTPRPGRIHSIIDVPFGADRDTTTREAPEFFAKVTEVREALRAEGAI